MVICVSRSICIKSVIIELALAGLFAEDQGDKARYVE